MTDHQNLQPFSMLKPPPDKCQECAVAHKPTDPHDAQSLFYQYHFYGQHGRWPTWGDAMAHCDEETQGKWKRVLETYGITGDKVLPSVPKEGGDS